MKRADKAFENIKERITKALLISLPDFSKVFEVECDGTRIGIGGVLSQENLPLACFSEKLNETKQNCSTYNMEFYVVVQSHVIGVIICYTKTLSSIQTMRSFVS